LELQLKKISLSLEKQGLSRKREKRKVQLLPTATGTETAGKESTTGSKEKEIAETELASLPGLPENGTRNAI